jgi:hypothetical protein
MELLEQIEEYLARSGVSPSTFGRMAAGDPRLISDLRAGRCPRQKTRDRLSRFLISAADSDDPAQGYRHDHAHRSDLIPRGIPI